VNGLRLRFVRFSGDALTQGVVNMRIDGIPVRVYSVAKTVADCFKYRNKIGLEVALRSFRESVSQGKCSRERRLHFAKNLSRGKTCSTCLCCRALRDPGVTPLLRSPWESSRWIVQFNESYQLQNKNILGNIILIMARTGPLLLPRISRILRGYGENLKLARLRRRYSAEAVAQRAGISRKTLSRVEKGDSTVALGIYARVMQALRLEEDLTKLAADDPLGRKLQDAALSPKRRAPKRRSSSPPLLGGAKTPKEMP